MTSIHQYRGRPAVDLSEAVRLYHEEHLSLNQVGSRLGVSRQRIHQIFVKHGIDRRPRSKPTDRPAVSRSYGPAYLVVPVLVYPPGPTLDRGLLRRLHAGMGLDVDRIADLLSVEPDKVRFYLSLYKVPLGGQHLRYPTEAEIPPAIRDQINDQRAFLDGCSSR